VKVGGDGWCLIPSLIKLDTSLFVFAGFIPATQEHEPLRSRCGERRIRFIAV
jgi:hypothetical protein